MQRRALIYTRMSLANDLGHERQHDACQHLAKARGWEVVGHVQDTGSGFSARLADREGWKQVVARMEAGEIDVVLVWHLDRLTRSTRDLVSLIDLVVRHDIGIATATGDIDLSSDSGRLVARILAAVAEAEVERKGARQRLANRQLAVSGKPWTGGPRPFGYTEDQLDVVPEEAEAFRWAAQAVLDGVPMRQIALQLEERGFSSSRAKHGKAGAGFQPHALKRTLLHPRYAGIRVYRGEEQGKAAWPAIIDMDTHLELKRALSVPKSAQGYSYTSGKPGNLLSNIARCAVCGDKVPSSVRGSARKDRSLTYTCMPAGHITVPRELADERVSIELLGLLMSRDFVETIMEDGNEEVEASRTELDALKRRLQVLSQSFASGTVDEETFIPLSHTLRERISDAEERVMQTATGSMLTGLAVGTEQVAEQWIGLPLDRQRLILDALLDVELRPSGRNRKWVPEEHLLVRRRELPSHARA